MEINQQLQASASASASSAAHRRISLIASHFAATDHDSSSLPTLLPMNCSSTLNLGTPRGDSRMYFARQGSNAQAFFMRQVSQEQDALVQPDVGFKSSATSKGTAVTALNRLMYSRPATIETKYTNVENVQVQPLAQDHSVYAPDPPKFARPNNTIVHEPDFASYEQISIQKPVESHWSPKMDIVETQSSYVINVEVPGIGINDIRVEVNNQKLLVMGNRATQWWKLSNCSGNSVSRHHHHHKRGIAQGPYQVEWLIPSDANKDAVTAQYVNGILEVTIPKVQSCSA